MTVVETQHNHPHMLAELNLINVAITWIVAVSTWYNSHVQMTNTNEIWIRTSTILITI